MESLTFRQCWSHLFCGRRLQAVTVIAVIAGLVAPSGAGLAAPQPPHQEIPARAVALGGGSYRVTASVFAEGTDGQVGTQTSSGHWIQPNDNLVALPGCTESSCPWVPLGTGTEGTYGPQTTCAEDDGLCWVKIVSDTTGRCAVAPVHDRGPLFVRDNWWAPMNQREYNVPQGIPAAEYARDGINLGFGRGISDAGHDIQNIYRYAAGIDLAGGTWKALGLAVSAGVANVTVTMLWQAGIDHDNACSGSPASSSGPTGTVFGGGLHLRSGPGLDSPVMTTMPNGAQVTVTGQSVGGFLSISWQGRSGWASAAYIDLPGPSASAGASATVADGPLNMRSSASTNASILKSVPDGAVVTLTGESAGGFLRGAHQGTTGWLFAAYLSGGGEAGTNAGSTASVIDGALNLRSAASTTAAVLRVMPDGAAVTLLGSSANGFHRISYQGVTGWAWSAYLSTNGSSASSAGTARVIDGALNLRTSASTNSGVLRIMPDGASVTLLGQTSNGFTLVSYQGMRGWAYALYLSSGGGRRTVFDGALNLRDSPSTSSTVLRVMPNGAVVSMLGDTENGFAKVTWDGVTGWAYATYLQ
ncbi:MAG: SH3 domain-containing protein [Thermomicrobiales bacterium]